MTSMDLLQYIGAADDKYIMESRRRPKKRFHHWPETLVAGLLVVLVGVAVARGVMDGWGQNAVSSAAAEAGQSVPAEAPAEEPAMAAPEEPAEDQFPAAEEAEVPEEPVSADVSAYDVTLLAQPTYPESLSEEDYEARNQRWQENQVSDDTSYALNAFAYSTASRILKDQTDSGCYSPLSLYQALAVLTSGAGGQTRDELLSLLGIGDLETLADQAGKLYRVNYTDNEADFLKIANSLWLDETATDGTPVDYNQEWVLSAAADYYAEVYQAEFEQPETAEALGAWIAQHTGGFLHPTAEELSIPEETLMTIVNTVWYKSHWADPFQESATRQENFTTESGETVSVDFMHRSDSSGHYIKGEDYTKSYLRLSQGRMIIVLPDEGVDVDSLLSEDRLWEIFENGDYQSAEVQWSVPKFETDVTYNLEETLQSLGITTAFTDNADFFSISDTPLKLSKVQQGTHIAVNEDGVEAAAYTMEAMEAAAEAPSEPEIVEMNLNRPFIYLITANDGSTVFMGVVRNPVQ